MYIYVIYIISFIYTLVNSCIEIAKKSSYFRIKSLFTVYIIDKAEKVFLVKFTYFYETI